MQTLNRFRSGFTGWYVPRSAAVALSLAIAACGGGGGGGGDGGGTPGGADPGRTVADLNGQPVTIAVTSGGGNVTRAERVTDTSGYTVPPGLELPNGVFSFDITGVPSGGTVTVRMQLPSGSNPASYLKCDGSKACSAFAGASVSGNVITLILTDNGAGDSNPAAGVITDPGAPARQIAAGCSGDDCRRAVLKDIGEQIILPALQDFDTQAAALKAAVDAYAASPASTEARNAARGAWKAAMASWQRNEILQVGPAGRSQNPDAVAGGQDFRDLIYSWPLTLNACGIENAANTSAAVDGNTAVTLTGLGALEYLLFTDAATASCAAQPDAAKRALHAQKLAAWSAQLATSLRNRWEPASGNFIRQWSTAGAGSAVYVKPQDALNAMSIALFYTEKMSKDRKIALTVGIGATGLSCGNPSSCPEFLESRQSRTSGANLKHNLQTFKDVFTGVNGKLGINDLLKGIGRTDLADEIVGELDASLARLASIESAEGFDAAVEAIPSRTECVNASSSLSGVPPCVLNGLVKTAMDTLRGPIVSALSLAIPNSAAGDND